MSRSLEQNCRELSPQVSLPHPCILRRDKIYLVDQKDDLLALFDGLVFDFFVAAAFGVSRVEDFNDHI